MERTLELGLLSKEQGEALLPLDRQGRDDAFLVEQARAGVRSAFDVLFERHRKFVYNICYRILGSYDDAIDATQRSFIQAHAALGNFRGGATFRTWLYRIATNAAVGMARQQKRAQVMVIDEAPTQAEDPHCEVVWETMLELPADMRAVLVLFYLEGLSGRELAQALGCSEGAARTRLYRARQAFKDKYEGVNT